MSRYTTDQTTYDVLHAMNRVVKDLARPHARDGFAEETSTPAADQSHYLGLAILTDAGSDAAHWKWKFAMRGAADGKWVAGGLGGDATTGVLGECVIANALPAYKGMVGLVYLQLQDDDKQMITFVPVSSGASVYGFITGNAAGGGKYVGKSYTLVTTDISASGDLGATTLGTLAGSADCLILNMSEVGFTATHYLTATVNTDNFAIYFEGTLVRTNADGTKVVAIDKQWAGCGPDLYSGTTPTDWVDGVAVD